MQRLVARRGKSPSIMAVTWPLPCRPPGVRQLSMRSAVGRWAWCHPKRAVPGHLGFCLGHLT